MRTLEAYDPITVTVFFAAATGIIMFCREPYLLLLSLLGALSYDLVRNGTRSMRTHLPAALISLVPLIADPLVSHNGVTVLFVLNDAPITLEAVVYGAITSVMLFSMLTWLRSFTELMTSDRLLHLFGRLSPKTSLVLSMALRYVPLFKIQAQKTRQTQTALGLYKDNSLIDRFMGELRIFSVMVTWSLENGIITADSMAARGYGVGRRSSYTIFRYRRSDLVLTSIIAVLFAVTVTSLHSGALDFTCYPSIEKADTVPLTVIGYIAYGLLVLLPVLIEVKEKLKWKYLQSKL